MLSWLPALLGLIPAGLTTIQGITSAISNEKIAGITAKTDQDKIASAERVAQLEAQRDLMIASAQKSNLDIWIRSALALGPVVILSKIFIWDKSIGPFVGCVGNTEHILGCTSFSTDGLDPNLWYVVMVAIGFYYLTSMRK